MHDQECSDILRGAKSAREEFWEHWLRMQHARGDPGDPQLAFFLAAAFWATSSPERFRGIFQAHSRSIALATASGTSPSALRLLRRLTDKDSLLDGCSHGLPADLWTPPSFLPRTPCRQSTQLESESMRTNRLGYCRRWILSAIAWAQSMPGAYIRVHCEAVCLEHFGSHPDIYHQASLCSASGGFSLEGCG